MIRDVNLKDAEELADIYNYYIKNTNITFEETLLSPADMEERIKKVTKNYPWIIWEDEGEILGYAYGSRWKERAAYKRSVESTVYVKNNSLGKGIGSELYKELIKSLRTIEIHLIIAGIALPNKSSQKLHEKMGFKKCAQFHEVGFKKSQWIDVGYWELILNE